VLGLVGWKYEIVGVGRWNKTGLSKRDLESDGKKSVEVYKKLIITYDDIKAGKLSDNKTSYFIKVIMGDVKNLDNEEYIYIYISCSFVRKDTSFSVLQFVNL
jgi:hypothetical protein